MGQRLGFGPDAGLVRVLKTTCPHRSQEVVPLPVGITLSPQLAHRNDFRPCVARNLLGAHPCAPIAPEILLPNLSIPPPLVRHTSRGRKRPPGGRHDTAHFQTDREIICRIGPGRPRSVDSLWKSAMGGGSAEPPPRPDGRGEPGRTPSGPVGGIARPPATLAHSACMLWPLLLLIVGVALLGDAPCEGQSIARN